ncbi:At5g01610-like protein [Dioscorea alata]|uniref:At5g01610-like protein n=1 Tax=Dioscorea alata TaxID=55571 RepID=A0ACB7UN07_DIOAL|nr:At5g01610-like protein [Dioscorea alata]
MPRHPAGPTKHSTCILSGNSVSFRNYDFHSSSTMAALHRIFSPSSLLLLLFLFSTSSASTVYEILTEYGLPQGLLPDAVKEYSLSSNGDFVVELYKPCYVHFSLLVYYEKTITGKLEHGQISNLSGIQVRKFFIWVGVDGIVAGPDGRTLDFNAGMITEKHPVSEFAEIRPCKSNARTSCRGAESLSLISEV